MSEQLERPLLPSQPTRRLRTGSSVWEVPEVARGAYPGPVARRGPLARVLSALRVRQWTKNALVLGAPIASGRVLDGPVALGAAVAFVAFCLAASCVYLLNDVRDAESDRRHPLKRLRPVASGEIAVPTAVAGAVLLGAGALALAFARNPELGTTIVVYLAVQAAYSTGLKDQPALDLAAISAGFLLRAIAGGVAAGLPMSPWFLLVATFGSLFMVAGKRYSEMRRLGSASGTRRSLESYSESYLRFIWSMAAGVTVVVYCLWVMAAIAPDSGPPWALFSLAPFVLGLLRYAADIDRGTAESPEDIVLADRHLQVIGLAWLVLVVLHAASR